MKRILINGLGCPFSGSKYILDEFLGAFPADCRGHVHLPLVDGKRSFAERKNLTVSYFRFGLWNLPLRFVYELYCNLIFWLGRYDSYINFSNYGMVWTRKQVLYLHNQLIVDNDAARRFGGGNPNVLTRALLNFTLRRSGRVVVQTLHMKELLTAYCASRALPMPSVKVLRPMPSFPVQPQTGAVGQKFPFHLFYPSTNFPHKNIRLAIESVAAATVRVPGLGLEITCTEDPLPENVRSVGLLPRADVLARMQTCDAILFTSRYETLGLPVLEALYYRKPAVLPDLPYAREIYGDAGVYFTEFTTDAVVRAIAELYDTYDCVAGKTAAQSVREFADRLGWEQQWKEMLAW